MKKQDITKGRVIEVVFPKDDRPRPEPRTMEIVFRTPSEEPYPRFMAGPSKPKPKYKMERVMRVTKHPLFGRVETPVTYKDKNGRVRVKMRRVVS